MTRFAESTEGDLLRPDTRAPHAHTRRAAASGVPIALAGSLAIMMSAGPAQAAEPTRPADHHTSPRVPAALDGSRTATGAKAPSSMRGADRRRTRDLHGAAGRHGVGDRDQSRAANGGRPRTQRADVVVGHPPRSGPSPRRGAGTAGGSCRPRPGDGTRRSARGLVCRAGWGHDQRDRPAPRRIDRGSAGRERPRLVVDHLPGTVDRHPGSGIRGTRRARRPRRPSGGTGAHCGLTTS